MKHPDPPTSFLRNMSAARRGAIALAALALVGATWGALRWRMDAERQLTAMASGTWIAGAKGALRALVRDGTGQGAAGVTVAASLAGAGTTVELGTWTTGAHGEVEVAVDLPSHVAGGAYTLEVVMGAPGTVPAEGSKVALPVQVERAVQVAVSTDKPEYRPGEAVRWRALLRRLPDLVPLADESLACELLGPDDVRYAGKAPTTSAFGLAAGEIALPAKADVGAWRIRVGRPGFALDVAERPFIVRADARPEIELVAALAGGRRYAVAGESLAIAVCARHAQGGPLAGGSVALVRTEPVLDGIGTQRAALSDDGAATLEIALPPRLGAERLDVAFVLAVTHGDRTEHRALVVPVAQEAIQVTLVPVGGSFRGDGVEHELAVSTATPDGDPIACAVELTRDGLVRRATTDAQGLALVPVDPAREWRATARAGALTGTRVLRPTDWASSALVLRATRSLVRAGEEATFTLAGPDGAVVLVDLEANGLLCWTGSVELGGGQATVAVPIGVEAAGIAVVKAYRLVKGTPADPAFAPLVVVPAGALAIEARYVAAGADRGAPALSRLVPGDRVRCHVALTDEAARPVAGAVWLSALDRALAHREGGHVTSSPRGRPAPSAGALPGRPGGPSRADALEVALASSATEPQRTAALALLVGERWARTFDAARALGASWSAQVDGVRTRRRGLDQVALPVAVGVLSVGAAWVALAVAALRVVLVHGALGGAGLALGVLATVHGLAGSAVFAAWVVALAAQWRWAGWLARLGPAGAGSAIAAGALAIAVGVAGTLAGSKAESGPPATGMAQDGVGAMLGSASMAEVARLRLLAPGAAAKAERPDRAGGGIGNEHTPELGEGGALGKDIEKLKLELRARARFTEVAWWTPNLVTDERGLAQVDYTVPDDAAIWRARVGAVDARGRLGAAECELDARPSVALDLPVPAVLAPGDVVELVALAHCTSDAAPARATVAISAAGARVESGATASVALARTSPGRIAFRLVAGSAGGATVRLVATDEGGAVLDALECGFDVATAGDAPAGAAAFSMAVRYPPRVIAGQTFVIAVETLPIPDPVPARIELTLALPGGVALAPDGRVTAVGDGVRVVSARPGAGALVVTLEGVRADRTIALEVGVRARWVGRFAVHRSVVRDLADPARWGAAAEAALEVHAP